MVVYSATFICTSVIIALLLDRGVCDAGTNIQFATSSPWFPSGPPLIKPSTDEATAEALQKILPLVTFDCKGKTGYFPDSKFNCEVFHYCKPDGARNSFHCPRNSLFNQLSMVCEEKSHFNTRLCKEGSIGSRKKTTKSTSKQPPKKKYMAPNAHKHNQARPAAASNNSKSGSGYIVTLEDLLGYMNNDYQRESTVSSGFYASQGVHRPGGALVKPPTPSEKNQRGPSTNGGPVTKSGSPKMFSKLVNSTVVRKDSPKLGMEEDVSIEYDAIEGRKKRKHVRVGRVLDMGDAPEIQANGKRQAHSHVSARSPTESPPEDITRETSTTKNVTSSAPRLFTADRSKAKDFRKRRRNLNRRKKLSRSNDTTTTDAAELTEVITAQTSDSESTTSQYNRHKSHRDDKEDLHAEMSQSWLGLSASGKVEPYTLPPLPTDEDEGLETTTQISEKEDPTKKKRTEKSGRNRNLWYKTTPVPTDDLLGTRFGEKISDLDHNPIPKTRRPTEHYEEDFEHHPSASGENKERSSEHSKLTLEGTKTPSFKYKYRNGGKKHGDHDERFFHFPLPSANRERLEKAPQDFFPPPRAEPRELPPVGQQVTNLYESSVEKETTERPYKSTHSFIARPNTRVRDQLEKGEHHWTLSGDKRKSKRRKVQVGSTFSSHGSASEMTTGLAKEAPTTTEFPMLDAPAGRKELPKITTVAHQHLLKLMNDFFALSSDSKDPTERATEHYRSIEVDMATPVYKTSEEELMAGAETGNDEMEELPSELLDVVDFITGQSTDDEKEPEPEDSHEVIKISGPITNAHLKEILSNDDFDVSKYHKKSRKESVKKIVVVPPEEKENYKEISEIAKFASLRMNPMFKQVSSDRPTMTVIPLNTEPPKKKPTVMSAKKIPVRVIYKDQLGEPTAPRVAKQPNLKVIRSRIPNPTFQVIQNGRMPPTRSYSQPQRKPQSKPQPQPQVVIQPKSVYPPHPPPLPKNAPPFKFGFPFGGGGHPMMPHMQYMSRRRKRSVLNRDRRQLRPNSPFLPFPRQLFPTFNPKFVPTFSPFKSIFSPNGLHTSGSSVNPFAFPRPPYGGPPVFKPSDSQPVPVRHVTQAGHQTVIVEEVPVPIHVEVPDPNLLRPVHPGNLQKNLLNPFPSNQFRSPSPPAITTPPLVHGFQGRFPGNPNYRPLGMPSNVRPPVLNYQPSLPFSQPLPPSITNQGQVYALGVTNKPFGPMNPPPVRVTNGLLDVTGKPSGGPFQHFDVHANAYPNFPYFQGAFTTPLSDDSVPGRIMYSGYKPPKTTVGTKPPRTTSMPNRERKENHPRTLPPRSKPTQSYYHVTKRPTTEYVSYNSPSGRTHLNQNAPREQSELRSIRPSFSVDTTPAFENSAAKRRRPYRKRRPRPYTSTATPTLHVSKDISPTPPPPEQIPPPPAEYTSMPLHQELRNSLQNSKAVPTNIETSSLYPPAGYYGKDQLVQFFDSSAKSYNKKASTAKPYEQNDLEESTSSAELDESVTSLSSEDSDQPAFGTRLRSKSQSQRRRKKNRQEIQSPTQRTEVRVRATASPEDQSNKRDSDPRRPYKKQENNDPVAPQKRQRPPPQYRARSRPSQKPEVNSFRYDDNNGFYSVPSGLQGLVDPSQSSQGNGRGSTDMFGIPHPAIDSSIYSIRPQGAQGDFNSNFFSVPQEVAQQQQSSLYKMDIKPIPKSAREFFSNAAKESSSYKNANSSENKEPEAVPATSTTDSPTEERKPQRPVAVRKLRKPKRKIRYNPRVNDGKQTAEGNSEKSRGDPIKPSTPSRESTTVVETTTPEPRPTYVPILSAQNDIKEPAFKQRSPLLPKTLPDISKSLLNGKIDIKKLNATISTSVSVSGAAPQVDNTHSGEVSNTKRVFSSQNGGLAVVRGNPKRKRPKQKSTSSDAFGSDSESSNKAKYEIAASVLDIIKATTETEKNGAGFYSNRYEKGDTSTSSPSWPANPSLIDIEYKRRESR